MPRVPILTGPTVRLKPLNVPEARPEAEGMAAAAGLQAAAKVVDVFGQMAERADRAVVENAEVSFAREVDQLLVNEAQTGFLQQKGVSARDAYQKLNENFDKVEQVAMKDLNARQQAMFKQTAAKSRVIAMRRADDYLDQELKAVEATNSKALQQTAMSRIARDAADFGVTENHITDLVELVNKDANRAGLDKPAREALITQAQGTARYAQIAALVDAEKSDEAIQIFETYKDQLNPEQRSQASQLIEQETIRTRSQKESDRIIAESKGSERDALAKARQLSGTLRDQVEQRITTHFNQQAQLKKQEQSDALNAVAAELEQKKSLNFLRGERLLQMQQIPGAMEALQARERQLQRFGLGGEGGGGGGKTDWNLWARLMQDAKTNPEALVAIDPAFVRPGLADTEFKWFVQARAEAMGNPDGVRERATSAFNMNQMIRDDAFRYGYIKASPSEKLKGNDLEKFDEVAMAVRSSIRAAEIANGNKAISVEQQKRITAETIATYADVPSPTRTAPPPPTPIGRQLTQQEGQIDFWSRRITQLGGRPTLAKINKMQDVIRRYPPSSYTDADREREWMKIALEP